MRSNPLGFPWGGSASLSLKKGILDVPNANCTGDLR